MNVDPAVINILNESIPFTKRQLEKLNNLKPLQQTEQLISYLKRHPKQEEVFVKLEECLKRSGQADLAASFEKYTEVSEIPGITFTIATVFC